MRPPILRKLGYLSDDSDSLQFAAGSGLSMTSLTSNCLFREDQMTEPRAPSGAMVRIPTKPAGDSDLKPVAVPT